MKRTMLLLSSFLIATLISGWVNLAEAQDAGNVYRVGLLRFGRKHGPTTSLTYGIRQGLRELGYVEGQNLVIAYSSARGKPERRAAELVRLKVDVIVTGGAPSMIRAAQGATSTIPIVVAGFRRDPVEAGLVQSLARPGGNITGLTNLETELHPKRLELLKEAFPQISRVAIIWPIYQQERGKKAIEAAAQALGIKIQSLYVHRPGHFEPAFYAILHADRAQPRERPDGLLVATAGLKVRRNARIRVIEFVAKRRLPTIYARRRFVDAGGLMSYGTDFQHLYRRAATYVDKILKGAKPGDLPVKQPTKFELIINLRTAKQIGVTIPREMLFRADKVIKSTRGSTPPTFQ